jgi:short-subunit dehydrogenase
MDGPLAIVTGASSGIGDAFARKLAARGFNLVVIARRGERLQSLKRRLESEARIGVRPIVADLTDQAMLRLVADEIARLDGVDLLVNSAGFGTCGDFATADRERMERELVLDLIVPATLSRAVLPAMIARRQGAIVNVSSMAAFLPIPSFAVYCAAKAGLVRLTQALLEEAAGSGVRLQALCPGPVPSEFFGIAGYPVCDVPRFLLQSADDCVESSLRALEKGRVVHIPKGAIRLFVVALRLLPLALRVKILGRGPDWWRGGARPGRALIAQEHEELRSER